MQRAEKPVSRMRTAALRSCAQAAYTHLRAELLLGLSSLALALQLLCQALQLQLVQEMPLWPAVHILMLLLRPARSK